MTITIIVGLLLIIGKILRDLERTKTRQSKADQFIELKSSQGCSIVCPSQWTSLESKTAWVLKTADEQATFSIYTVTMPAGGVTQIRETFIANITDASQAIHGEWINCEIGGKPGCKMTLSFPPEKSAQRWHVYVVAYEKYCYFILLDGSHVVLSLNNTFFENVVMTFKGI
jgi:hypothetical protein